MHFTVFKILFLGNSLEKQSAVSIIFFFFFFLALYRLQIELEKKESSFNPLTKMTIYTFKREKEDAFHRITTLVTCGSEDTALKQTTKCMDIYNIGVFM